MRTGWSMSLFVTATAALTVSAVIQFQPVAAQGNGNGSGPTKTHSLNMIGLFAYRNAETEAISEEKKVPIAVNKPTEFTMGKFKVLAQRTENAYDSPSLFINISDRKTGKLITHTLYQYGAGLRNQFTGEHGFTGLNYVYLPQGTAELQFTCAIAP